MSAGDADAVVRWDSCRLDFFVSFLVKQKRKERKHFILKVSPHFRGNFYQHHWKSEQCFVGWIISIIGVVKLENFGIEVILTKVSVSFVRLFGHRWKNEVVIVGWFLAKLNRSFFFYFLFDFCSSTFDKWAPFSRVNLYHHCRDRASALFGENFPASLEK